MSDRRAGVTIDGWTLTKEAGALPRENWQKSGERAVRVTLHEGNADPSSWNAVCLSRSRSDPSRHADRRGQSIAAELTSISARQVDPRHLNQSIDMMGKRP